jgi:hypothetical protein
MLIKTTYMKRLFLYCVVILLMGLLITWSKKCDAQVLDSVPALKVELNLKKDKKEFLKWWVPTKHDYIAWGLFAVAGAADGINQSLLHHRLGQGDQFWDPTISWKNKYRDWDGGDKRAAYIGSKSFLVWTTDGYHLTRGIDHAAMYIAVSISAYDLTRYRPKDWWKVLLRRGTGSAGMRAALFNILYNSTGKR